MLEGASWRNQTYFRKYFQGDSFPKFILYSAHSETLFPFLQAFGVHQMEDPPAGSAIFFEWFKEDGEVFVAC